MATDTEASGAAQLAGPGVLGPPPDRVAAIEVLRTAVELGVNHIDTADAYGPYITNEIIREALFPYGDCLHIATKVGVVRDDQGGWVPGNSPQSLREQVHGNLDRLGLDTLDLVYLRTTVGCWRQRPPMASRTCRTSRSVASHRCSQTY